MFTSHARQLTSKVFILTQGNIANRERNENEEEKKPKKIKPAGVAERVRGGRSKEAKEPNPEPEKKPAASARGDAGENANDTKAKPKKEAAPKKEANAKMATLATKESKPSKGGTKRSSGDDIILNQQRGRSSKRSRKLPEVATEDEPVISRRITRSRSAPSRRKSSIPRGIVVDIIPAGDNRVVPQDFGLERSSFNGQNFTHGIAYYDASERTDPLLCKDYVTDMFQHLYQAEVSSRFVTF